MPFKLRYFIPALLLLAAAVIAVVSLRYSRQWAEQEAETEARLELTQNLNHLQSMVEYLLAHGDVERMREVIASLGSDPLITTAIFVDSSNIVQAALQRRMIGLPIDAALPKLPTDQMQLRTERLVHIRQAMIGEVTLGPDRLALGGVYPIVMEGDSLSIQPARVGLVYVLLDLTPLKAHVQRTVERQVIFYSFFLVALAAVLWLIFHFALTRRVRWLTIAAEQMGRGDLNSSAKLKGKDEIAELSHAFDQMAVRRKHAEEKLAEQKERAEVILHSIGDAVITTEADGTVEYLNPEAEQLTGWHLKQACGRRFTEMFNIVDEITLEQLESPLRECLADGTVVMLTAKTLLLIRNGKQIAIEGSSAPIRNREGHIIGAVVVFHDVSQARKMAHQLSWQATHDALTGLVNRREFERILSDALVTAKAEDVQHALLYLDLDQFKVVNDTCGHVAGDELLKQLTAVIQKDMRDADTLSRLGGDEFGVLLQYCPLEQAQRVAENLCQTVKSFRFAWELKTFEIGVSIGLVPITAESRDTATLFSTADIACYAAKDLGRDQVQVFHESDASLAQRHGEMQWVNRIQRALKENRFRLYRQTIVPTQKTQQHIEYYEVLLRLVDEADNVILPGAFLPAAERYGLMPMIDRWVVGTLFATYGTKFRQKWETMCSTGSCDCMHTVNLSGMTLSDHTFLDFVRDQLQQWNVPTAMICFEITETAAIANLPHAMHFIRELKALGCRFALDDFGSGVSSFAYLKNLPVDFLKIDGGFVRGMVTDPVDNAMVEAINNIGHVMGIRTIAEFVDNPAILEILEKMGVDYAQGFDIGEPRIF